MPKTRTKSRVVYEKLTTRILLLVLHYYWKLIENFKIPLVMTSLKFPRKLIIL